MNTKGEAEFGSMLNGVVQYLDSIDFLTSTSYIKQGLNNVKQLAVNLASKVAPGMKQERIAAKIIEAAAWFTSQWKGANGDRSGYKVAPEVIEILKSARAIIDEVATPQGSAAAPATNYGQLTREIGAGLVPPSSQQPTAQVPSQSPPVQIASPNFQQPQAQAPTVVYVQQPSTQATSEKKEAVGFFSSTTLGIPNSILTILGVFIPVASIGAAMFLGKKKAPVAKATANRPRRTRRK